MERGVLSKSNTKVKKRASTRLKATRKECKMASLESSPKLSVDLMALKKRKGTRPAVKGREEKKRPSPLIAFNLCTRQLRPLAPVAVRPLPFVAFLGL